MAIRLQSEFTSQNGDDYKIEIHDSEWLGGTSTFNVSGNGFHLEYTGETDDIISPIISSFLNVPAFAENAAFETFLSNLGEYQDKRFHLEVFKDNGGYELFWVGWITQDLVRQEDVSMPYIVDIKATDGLGFLANIDYTDANPLSITGAGGLTKMTDFLRLSLNKIGLHTSWSTSDVYLETSVDWWETTSQTYSTTKDTLGEHGLDVRAFSSVDDNGDTTYTKVLEIIRQLAIIYNARIYQSGGRWVFEQYGNRAALSRYVTTYKKDGTAIATASVSDDITFDQTTAVGARLAGGEFSHLPAVNTVSLEYIQERLSPNSPPYKFIDGASTHVLGAIEGGTGVQLYSEGAHNYTISSTTGSTGNDNASIAVVFKMQIKIEDASNPGTFHYWTNTFNGYAAGSSLPFTVGSWSTTAGYFYYSLWFNKVFYGETTSSVGPTVTTTDLPVSGELTVINQLHNKYDTLTGSAYTLAAHQTENWSTIIVFSRLEDGRVAGQKITYSASNTNASVDSNIDLSLGEVSISSGLFQTGSVVVYNGTAWVAAITFRKGATGTGWSMLNLACVEAAALHYSTIKVYDGTMIYSDIFSKRLGFDSSLYLPISSSYNASNDEWSVSCFAIARDTTTIGDLDPIEIPALRSIQGVSGISNTPDVINTGRIGGMNVDTTQEKMGPFQQVTGGAKIIGALKDGEGSFGSSGQVLSSTVSGLSWITSASTNDYVTGMTFNTADGILTLTRSGGLGDITQDLDGRYLTQHPTIINSGSTSNANGVVVQSVTIDSNGHSTAWGTLDLDTRFLQLSGGTMTGELTVTGKLHGVTAGTANTDAVNVQQLNNATTGVLVYQGIWNASTNTPTLTSATGTIGGYYIVSVDGSTNLDGITDWKVGDWAVFSDMPTDAWQKIDNTSILGGAGTGGSLAAWTGSGTSLTLGDAPITYSGNNVTVAGTIDSGTITSTGTVAGDVLKTDNGANNWSQSVNGSGKLVINQNGTQRGIWSGGELQLTNDLIVDGNIGVGMAAGTIPGEIKGRASDGKSLRLWDNGSTDILDLYNNGTNAYINTTHSGGAGNPLLIQTNSITALTLDTSQNATFAGKVIAGSWYQGYSNTNTLWSSTADGVYLQTPGLNSGVNESKIFFRNSGGTVKHTFDTYNGNATFAGDVGIGASPSGGYALNMGGHINMQANDIYGGDNSQILLGASQDLQIYHDGSNSYIKDTGTGNLEILADSLSLLNAAGSEYYARFYTNGAAYLYHNGVAKLNTTSTGVTVTGVITATGGTSTEWNTAYGWGNHTGLYLRLAGDTMAGNIDMDGFNITNGVFATQGGSSSQFTKGDGSLDSTEYLALTGGTLTGAIRLNDSVQLQLGSSNDALLMHNGSHTYFVNGTGNLYIQSSTGNIDIENLTDDADIYFRSDNGSGGTTAYFYLDGSETITRFPVGIRFEDNIKANFGASNDLQIYHDGSNSYIIDSGTGGLILQANSDFAIQSYGTNENFISAATNAFVKLYFDGSEKLATTATGINVTGTVQADNLTMLDNEYIRLGNSNDLQIYHNGSDSYITNTGGETFIKNGDDLSIQDTDGTNRAIFQANAQKLYYDGSLKFETTSTGVTVTGSIKMADDATAASATNVGTQRYRTSGSNSYVDMCMQTGGSTYEWVNILENNW